MAEKKVGCKNKLNINVFKKVVGYSLWAFTVKVNKDGKYADQRYYEPFFTNLYQLSKVLTVCGEDDTKNILHYHGVIRIKNKLFRKNLCVKGYHVNLTRIHNLRGWLEYCHKRDVLYCFEDCKQAILRSISSRKMPL